MTGLILTLEGGAGATIDELCVELQGVADRVGIITKAEFNGVMCFAKPGGDAAVLYANWGRAVASKIPHKTAYSK